MNKSEEPILDKIRVALESHASLTNESIHKIYVKLIITLNDTDKNNEPLIIKLCHNLELLLGNYDTTILNIHEHGEVLFISIELFLRLLKVFFKYCSTMHMKSKDWP